MAPEQLEDEFIAVVELIQYVFGTMGFSDFRARLGTNDPAGDKYAGAPEMWERGIAAIRHAADKLGLNYTVEEGEAAYLPLAHRDDFGTRAAGQLLAEEALTRLRPLLEDTGILKIGHDLKHAVSVLARLGIALAPYDDVMLLSYVLDGAAHGHGLAELARLHLDRPAVIAVAHLESRQARPP